MMDRKSTRTTGSRTPFQPCVRRTKTPESLKGAKENALRTQSGFIRPGRDIVLIRVKVDVLIVEGSIPSLNEAVIVSLSGTFVRISTPRRIRAYRNKWSRH